MIKNKILIAIGTRPEVIKLVPLIRAFQFDRSFKTFVCLTGQHREMLDQMIRFFNVRVDADFRLMRPNQSLEYVAGRVITKFGKVIRQIRPDLVFVQGDTATAVMVTISSYYSKIPIAHLEAGLRTRNKYHPFPEEGNRTLISHLADFHFTPTRGATRNLLQEGIDRRKIFEVGNTVVDCIKLAKPLIKKRYSIFQRVNLSKKLIFVTAHRRESFGHGLDQIFLALRTIVKNFPDTEIVYPVHLNPRVYKPARKALSGISRIHLIRPLSYEETLWIMSQCYFILTDSGGIQEEAPSFKKPVLVLRNFTERPEGIHAGIAKLVGTSASRIVREASALIASPAKHRQMMAQKNPYGDGFTAQRIIRILHKFLK